MFPRASRGRRLSRRTLNVARELSLHASAGDRAVILAPQGLDYIAAFLGSMQAGLIAVPLPLPHRGSSHERVGAVLADTSPSVVLTTSAVAADVTEYVDQSRLDAVPKIIEIDSMDLDVDGGTAPGTTEVPSTAYLQYSSGSTRPPTGVMISHRNLQVNFEQLMRSYLRGLRRQSTAGYETIVSWLPFYHDMGLVLGVCAPILGGYRGELTSPVAFLERPARWVRVAGGEFSCLFGGAKLRLRPGRPQDHRQRPGRARPRRGAGHHQRRRTGRAGHIATLRRSVRALQFSRPHDAPVIWLGGGDRLRGEWHLE